jgi:hypothetical protein
MMLSLCPDEPKESVDSRGAGIGKRWEAKAYEKSGAISFFEFAFVPKRVSGSMLVSAGHGFREYISPHCN